jgi:hypothetical protein
LRTFQSKWLLINQIIITFLADFVPFKEKYISPNVQAQIPQNLMEMCFTKSSSSCKNLSFIWLLDCYQNSILPPLLHGENCCTIADKIHSKTEASLIQFSWNFYSISYDKSRACKPIFMSFTLTWLKSQLTQILQYRTYFNRLSYTSSNVNQTWN